MLLYDFQGMLLCVVKRMFMMIVVCCYIYIIRLLLFVCCVQVVCYCTMLLYIAVCMLYFVLLRSMYLDVYTLIVDDL